MNNTTNYAPRSPDLTGFTAPPAEIPPFPTLSDYRTAYEASPYFNNQIPSEMPPNRRVDPSQEEWDPTPAAPRGRGRRRTAQEPQESATSQYGLAPGIAEGIEVKTKFPVARIKRIMQADEDVGKVAQVTPIAVGQ